MEKNKTMNKIGDENPGNRISEIKQNADNANLILRNLYDNKLSKMSVKEIRTEIGKAQSLLRSCN
jgi:hypothetical protein